jgi:hypothetical protein
MECPMGDVGALLRAMQQRHGELNGFKATEPMPALHQSWQVAPSVDHSSI